MSQIESRLEKIRETLENDTELAAAREELGSAKAERDKSEHARRSADEEVRSQQVKIQQAESSLYGGTIHNPKELQDLQADVGSLKKHLEALEERELAAMMRLESADKGLQGVQQHLDQIQERLEAEHRILIDEQRILARDVEDLKAERQAAVSAMAAELLATYEGLRRVRRGLAVAEVSENACGACGTILTAALQQNARHAAQLVYCPSCGRILYAG